MSTPIHLSYDEVKAELQQIVAEKGDDFIYDSNDGMNCVYFADTGEPSCIIGHLVARHGMDYSVLDEGGWNHDPVTQLYRHLIVAEDPAVEALLETVQGEQDRGVAWGNALRHAIARAEEVAGPPHSDYPHQPGYLDTCIACEATCHCNDGTDAALCVWPGHEEG